MSNHGSILFIAKGGSIQSETGDIIASVDSSGNATIPASVQLVMSNGESINDTNSNELLKFGVTASAVNEVTLTNAATGNAPSLSATGGDTNISITLSGKGTGAVQLGQSTSTDVRLVADQPIADSSGNEYLKFSKTASAVNEVTFTNAATGTAPSIAASGGDTDVSVIFSAKGAGYILHRTKFSHLQGAAASKTTSTTLTPAEITGGIIIVNQGGGAASHLQLPLATDLDALLTTFAANDSFDFSLINTSTVAAEDADLTTNTGWTLIGNMDVASNAAATDKSAGRFRARKTGTGAWSLYRLS